MPRILAIDYGTKRTGLAVTDPEKRIAGELATVPSKDVMVFIKNYVTKEDVECIVVGDPKQMDNTPSQVAALVQQFVNKLKKVQLIFFSSEYSSLNRCTKLFLFD